MSITPEVPHIIVPEQDSTLVLIDMQPDGFIYSRWMVKPVLQLIDAAISQNHGICLVQYVCECAGTIAEEITRRLEGYPRKTLAKKTREDGSAEVIEACLDAGLTTADFQVAGVTTDDCVVRTVRGLSEKLPDSRIAVIKNCCECWQGKRYDWSTFAQAANIFLI